MSPKRVQLSLSEKNAIAALHKAALKGPEITRETRYPLSTIYGVLKRFRQRETVERGDIGYAIFVNTPEHYKTLWGCKIGQKTSTPGSY
jgi:uncharacterized membrane protein